MKKNLTMQLMPLWLLAFFFFTSVPIKAQTNSEATPRVGIVKLIGCGTGNEANKAQIQVMHDGTGYSYNFGANASARSGNTAWVPAGTRTITVTKGSRVYKLPITVPDKVVPTFTPTITYNCNGTADVLLTNNQGTYNYTYTYGSKTDNSPYFKSLAVGQHTVTVKYTPPVTTEKRVVFYDDFGTYNGETAKSSFSPYVNRNVFFDPLDGSGVQRRPVDNATRTAGIGTDSAYCIARRDDVLNGIPTVDLPNPIPTWLIPEDKDKEVNGKFLWYNVEHSVGDKFIVYQRKATVKTNAFFDFRASVYNPVYEHATNNPYIDMMPIMQLLVYANESDAAANVNPLYKSYELRVPKAAKKDDWYTLDLSGYTGSNAELVFVIRMFNNTLGPVKALGNDVALDNILVTQPSDSCEQIISVPVNVVTDTKTFSTTVVYNCAASTGNITITPTVTTGYEYTYSLDGSSPQTFNTFNNAAVGVHTLTITYKNTGAKTLFKEDFGSGAPYSLPRSVVPEPFVYRPDGAGYPGDVLQEGDYRVANHDNLIWMQGWGWKPVKSHGDNSNTGRFLAFNYGPNANKTFYQQDIQVEPNKLVTLEYYALNIDAPSNLPNIRATFINKATNATIATYDSGALPGRTSATYNPSDWQKITHTFNPGSATTIQLRFTNLNNNTGSNDFAIDDILVTQAYDTCTTTLTATVAPKVTNAFAGVTKLIGCGTGANASKAEVTIANVQGGTGAYEYNFDGTWVATNTGWLAAGTHTVSVRAAGTGNSCQYDMSVTVSAALAQPTIITQVFYGCDGRPTLKIGVQDPDPELTYMYSLDGGAYTTTYVYSNIATGTHQVSVQYEYRSAPSPMILWREDFGIGDPTPYSGVQAGFVYEDPRTQGVWGNGKYTVAAYKDFVAPAFYGTVRAGMYYPANPSGVFREAPKGTTTGANNDKFLYVDMATNVYNKVFLEKIVDINPNNTIEFSYQLQSADGPNAGMDMPNMEIKIVDANNNANVLGAIQSGNIPHDGAWHLVSSKNLGSINPNGVSRVKIQFINKQPSGNGNDVYIDDIIVTQTPKACGQEVTTTATIASLAKPTFSANVSNCSNTNSTITWVASPTTGYTYTYTLQGGTATSSNVFNGLATGNHTFTIDYAPIPNVITLLNEDFGVGTDAVKNQYVGKEWYFNNNTTAGYIAYNGRGEARNHTAGAILANDEYTIAANLVTLAGDWRNPVDKSGNANGRKLFVDGAAVAAKQDIYTRKVSVVPNYPLTFTSDFYNLVQAALVLPIYNTPANFAQVQLQLYENEAAYNASGSTPIYQNTIYSVTPAANTSDWRTQTLTLTAAQVGNRTEMYAVIRMHNVINAGHDLVVDNIRITQSIACQTTVTATVQNQVQNAFAGVTKLIGCGTGANANNAEVTIANVEGGSGTYEYQFDGITWTASNTGWLPVGTHTVSVRDGITKSCAYDMSVTVPATLAQPTIKTEVFYACDGKAILNVGVENPDPALKYLYSLDGAAYTTTYLYTNVASGTHSVSVQYEYANAPSPVMLLKETFGSGPDKCLDAGVTSLTCDVFRSGRLNVPNQGAYGIISGNSNFLWQGGSPLNCNSIWVPVQDHTSAGTDPQGLFFMADAKTISPNGDLFYKKKVKNVSPNSEIKYEFYILNLFNKDKEYSTSHGHASKPNIKVQLVANNGTVIASSEIGEVDNSDCNGGLSNWKLKEGTLNSGNNTEFTIEFRSNGSTASGGWGDDFCIDDIMVYQIPKACGQIVSATKTITPTGQDIPAFTVSKTYDCATGKGGFTVTPTATTGFTYTYTLGSTTYTSTTATFTGLDLEQTYTVSISYQAVSNTVTLLNEDFGVGTTPTQAVKSPYTAKDLYFNENKAATYNAYNANGQAHNHPIGASLQEAEYTIANGFAEPFPAWVMPTDHSAKPNGRIFFVNPPQSATPQPLYMREVNVLPNKELTFSAQFFNLFNNVGTEPKIQLLVFDSKAAYEANSNASAAVKASPITTVQVNGGSASAWKEHKLTLTATEVGTRSSVFVVVRMDNPQSNGHDLAMDDIKVTQKLPVCTTSVTTTLTKGDVATPTLTLPANLSVICSAPTASATISSWIASATATSTCGTATVTHNYTYPPNLCNVGGAVTVTFRTTDPFGNVVTATRVISFATMTLTVTPTTLSVPNGALGGTTSSVVPNITLGNTVSPSTNSVTITFSGLPTGVTSTTGGRLIVAPNTPAGSHTISYTVCETAGQNNCKTVNTQLVIGTGSLTVTPTNLTHPNGTQGGTTTGTVLTGVKINGNPVNTASVTITWNSLPPNATGNASGTVTIAPNTPAGTYTISYTVCESLNGNSNCQSVTSQITVGGGSLTATPTNLTHPNGTQGGTTTGTVLTGITLNGTTVTNTNSVTISFSGLPTGVTSNTNGQLVIPAGTPAGTHTITYRVCEKLNPTNCQTVTSTLVIGTGSLTVTPVTPLTVPNGISGGTTSSVLTGITLNGTTVTNTNSVTISFSGLPAGVTSNTNGQLVIPAGTPAGTHTITYKVCEKLNPTNCQTVTSTLVIGTGSLTVTPVTPLTVPNGISGGTTSSVLTGITLNGATVTNTNSVTISFSGLPTGVTSNTNGQLVIPAGTPAGTHTITYKVCEKLNPTNCQTVTSTLVIGTGSLTVTPVTPLTVPNGISGGTTSSVLTGITLNGTTVTNTNSVTISFSGLPTGVTSNTNGQLVIPAGTPAGTHTITYRVCEKLNPTNCQTVTSTLVIGTGSLTVTPVTPLTVPNGISGGTTSSVLTGITLNGTTVTNTNSVTISFSGLPTGVTSNTNGQLVIPAGTPAGTHTITYKVCEKLNPTNCQTVTSTLVIGTGSLTVTPVTPLTVPNGISGGTTSSVLTGITLNGTTVTNTNSVTISFSGLPTGVTSNTNGQLVIPAGTPAGTHTITYKVCEKLNPTNCQTVTSTLVIGTGSLTVTPVTPLTVPNGISGGTTSSVLTGITLNGTTVTNTNSVTISFSGLPGGVTTNTNGQLVIPAGTPAGTHTITYRVCEKLNPTNCQTVTSTLVIGTGSLTVTPTNLTHPNGTQGGTTTGTVLTGVKINGNPVNTASVTITWNSLPPNATGNASGTVTIAPNTPAGTYTISYTVCERLNGNSNCQSVTSQITIGGGNMTVTPTTLTHPNGTQGGTTTGTVLTGVKINGNPVNTASVTITWNSLPPNATGNASGTVTIAPNTPAGTYTISYTVCERLNGNSNCQSVTSQITIGGGSLTATPTTLTHPNGTQGGTTTGTVLTGVKINGNPVNTASVTITWNSLPPNATGNASGTVTIAPNTPAGTYTISYTVCESLNGNSNCQSVTSQITIGGGNMTVTPTQLIVANGATGGTSVNNVLTGVTINGNPVNTNSVTITWNSLPPGFTGTNSGTVTVPANTPAGTYTVSYTVCERLNQNNNCKTVTSTITVGNGNMIVVPTPITVPNGTIGGTSTPSVLTGVVLNGNSNPAPNTVSITWNTLPPRATGNNDGTVNVAPNTPAGTYTVSYTICEALNSGHCTTVTSTITIGGGVLTVTPVTTLTVANGTQGGTTTNSVLTGVSLNGQPANSQSVTITFSGLPAGVTSNTNGQLVVAPGTPATNTTIYYTVCETLNANNNCHTYSTTLVIGTPNLSVTPRTYAIPDATVGGTTSSVLETVTIDGHTPSSQSVTITFGNLPVGIQTTTSGGFRVPAGTPTGIHTVTYTVCEVLNPDHCVTSIATIAVGNVPVVTPNAFTYTGTATVTTPSILDDDTVGTQSATTGTGGNVVINITSTPTGTVVPSLDANNGRVTIPAGTPPGIYTITYDVCTTATPTACTPGAVVITIPNVPVITPDDMVYTDTTTTTAGNILTNDRVGTQSATAGNGGNVSITVTIPATPKAPGATVPTLNPNTGVVTVPAGTPSGTYTITYKICTTATPTSCDTGVVTITVSGTVTEAPDTNDVTAYTRINTPVTVGVTSSTTVTVSIPSQPANGTAVSNGDGTITYTPNNGFKGTDSFEYSLCNAAGCRTATISVRVTSELIIYNGVSIGGSDKNNHFHIEGIENYPNNTVRIYNRWGVKVFEMSGYNNTTKAFKGVSDARATLEASDNLPQGTYYYIVEYVDEHNKTQTETGWLYLKKN